MLRTVSIQHSNLYAGYVSINNIWIHWNDDAVDGNNKCCELWCSYNGNDLTNI